MPRILRNIGITLKATLAFFILHIFIAMLIKDSPTISTRYAQLVFLIGAWAALRGRHSLVVCIISYIVGGEVLWRMTKADLFWEFGKYAVSGILFLAILSALPKRRSLRNSGYLLIAYFILLLPAISLTPLEPFSRWRDMVSFNMSGPLSLCICGLYFSGLVFDREDLQRAFTWLIAPVICIAFISLIGIIKAPSISWGLYSQEEASGRFGPNQVCSILGLAAFLCIVCCYLVKTNRIFKIFMASVSFWFFSHAILTFSRGGVVSTGVTAMIYLMFSIRSRKGRVTSLLLGIFLILAMHFYITPKLNYYTKGMLRARYERHEQIAGLEVYESTGRIGFLLSDLRAFMREPLYGHGVGSSEQIHLQAIGRSAVAHTEWSRILSEHGILGVFSLFFLGVWVFRRYRYWSTKETLFKALALSFIAGVVLYSSHSAMRLALPAYIIGLLGADLK